MTAVQTFLDYSNLFSLNEYQKNGKIIHKYFNDKYGKSKHKPWIETKTTDEIMTYLIH